MTHQDELKEVLDKFQSLSIDLATGKNTDYQDWERARDALMQMPELVRRLPDWMVENRWGSQYWDFIKRRFPTYAERRQFIWQSFIPIYDFVERGATLPIKGSVDSLLETCSSELVSEAWEKIHQRRIDDPEGAITAARSMLESVCKYILDQLGEQYSDKEDLPQLYKLVASKMALSAAQQHEQIFKQILTGCGSVVGGLAGMRNKLGDAHGKGGSAPRPSPRHADLAANLAGSISAFLIATYEERFRS